MLKSLISLLALAGVAYGQGGLMNPTISAQPGNSGGSGSITNGQQGTSFVTTNDSGRNIAWNIPQGKSFSVRTIVTNDAPTYCIISARVTGSGTTSGNVTYTNQSCVGGTNILVATNGVINPSFAILYNNNDGFNITSNAFNIYSSVGLQTPTTNVTSWVTNCVTGCGKEPVPTSVSFVLTTNHNYTYNTNIVIESNGVVTAGGMTSYSGDTQPIAADTNALVIGGTNGDFTAGLRFTGGSGSFTNDSVNGDGAYITNGQAIGLTGGNAGVILATNLDGTASNFGTFINRLAAMGNTQTFTVYPGTMPKSDVAQIGSLTGSTITLINAANMTTNLFTGTNLLIFDGSNHKSRVDVFGFFTTNGSGEFINTAPGLINMGGNVAELRLNTTAGTYVNIGDGSTRLTKDGAVWAITNGTFTIPDTIVGTSKVFTMGDNSRMTFGDFTNAVLSDYANSTGLQGQVWGNAGGGIPVWTNPPFSSLSGTASLSQLPAGVTTNSTVTTNLGFGIITALAFAEQSFVFVGAITNNAVSVGLPTNYPTAMPYDARVASNGWVNFRVMNLNALSSTSPFTNYFKFQIVK